ncbi:aminotransferase class V-fold PLP-dependent enzyme [Shewanella maritima]|uniref:Aminotransferase class V-fold PLP-dependent enzyme n=1 Tax=Shewanella maritima TaxID=2520507 RepID=A0A411PJ61_9GAMM|nr:aminotransferase class V-fold PLP-dependent enzyme [Shewanella maritima]QBF83617.1 aminotransferase class V-fold PLP-dependent enzyme [Shewanella maritima]
MPRLTAEQLQAHYSDFNVSERILLSGHSHQAWPDVARQGVLQCYDDAAKHVDEKWGAALAKADEVRDFYRTLMGEANGQIALGSSTHELILRFMSDLDYFKQAKASSRPLKIVTTDSEFHSLRRQLQRLQELNCQIDVVPVEPSDTLAMRVIDKLDNQTDAVMLSAVFFNSSQIFYDVGQVAKAAHNLNIPCLVDAYHALNVVPFNLQTWELESAFVVGGGYKYCQAGEGNCFMRIPADYQGSPVITGWYAEFDVLDQAPGKVGYGAGQAAFAGSTYDPTSHYRAAAVFDFLTEQQLDDIELRQINQAQIKRLWQGIEAIGESRSGLLLPKHSLGDNAGFLSLTTPKAAQWVKLLAQNNVLTDSRGDQLRLGTAPYITDTQIDTALNTIESLAPKLV